MRCLPPATTLGLVVLVVSAFGACRAIYADGSGEAAARGTIELDTPELKLTLVRASQTVAALEPKAAPGFDFTPADQLEARSGDGFFHLGDLTLRLRQAGASDWKSYSTAAGRKPVTALAAGGETLAAADLATTLP